MAGHEGTTTVEICGERYRLASNDPVEHVRAVAAYVDRRCRELLVQCPALGASKATVLVAVQLADELLQGRERVLARVGSIVKLFEDPGRTTPT